MASCTMHIESKNWVESSGRGAQHPFRRSGTARMAELFRGSMPLPEDTDPAFRAALNHLLRHPGSMVRSRLVSRVACAYGVQAAAADDLAIALEYFHTASLVFDDLPCMDNATARRGAACVHVPFGEASAILSALALINRAYALTWKTLSACPAEVQSKAMEYLEQRLGVMGLLNGQSMDLNFARLPHDRQTTERIAYGKTVSLIRLTLVLPAMLGCAATRELRHLERMASCWGLAYQMLDDLKDVLQTTETSGKTSARDLDLGRPNIALAIGVPAAVARLGRLIHLGERMLNRLVEGRPELAFLGDLRSNLQLELSRVLESACEVMDSPK
ncbi:hypothetical protein DYQ86_25475 [Acidobacteria bacterium AB60]|nr:hypothetical protein DYQ86_25475 [Acidobacteria bacterium AB60]